MNAYCEIDLPQGDGRLAAAFAEPVAVLVARQPAEVPALLAEVEALAAGGHWLVGFVAYEAAAAFDPVLVTHASAAGLPLAAFAAYRAPGTPRARRPESFICGPWTGGMDRAAFDAAIETIRADIAEGRFYQVNLTARLSARIEGDGLAFFDALKASQPDAYCLHLDLGRWQISSVSPELFFHWRTEAGVPRRLTTRPMKGTAARDADPARDLLAAERLRASAKECAENLMIVDLLRNDLSRVARLGTVGVPQLFAVEAWPTVWQMTSTVECRTRPATRLAEVFAALFPCGSVTGAPKAEAMRAIATLESSPRGVYCGAVGVVLPGGEARFNVGIRTVVVDREAGRAECGIGSGITLDSSAEGEWAEWRVKEGFLRRACPDYELLETLLWRRGRYWLRSGHLARLMKSAAALGFPCDRAAVETALDRAAADFPAGPQRVRLRLAATGEVAIDAAPLEPTPRPVGFALAAQAVDSADPWLRHKTTRRGRYEALTVPGAFDTLLHNERGELTEFTRGNLVVGLDGRLATPPLACGLLPGVLRAALLARGTLVERVITRADLARAERVWFINSLRGAVPAQLVQD